jgi:preprotein translocase subunit SecE
MAETTRSNPLDFFRDVGEQVRKVTWPDRDQLRSSTGVVALFVLVVALIIFGIDYVINHGLALLSSLFTG